MDVAEDSELAVRVAAGDRAALAAVYDRYADRLFDFCNSMLRDREEAADAVQQCFLIAAQKMGSLREPSKMRAWLYAVARHDCLRRIRRRSREVVDQEVAEPAPSQAASDEGADVQSLQDLVWSAAKGLAPKDQALLDLHVRQGLNGQELADAVGVKASNVYVMVNRLKAQFERAMGALLVMRQARTECPELESILDGSGTEFTVLLRKRVARHIEGCNVCEDNRQRLASPLALLAAVPLVPAPLLLRDRVLRTGPPSGSGPVNGGTSSLDGPATGASADTPTLSGRTGFPKDSASNGLLSLPVVAIAVVVVAAVVASVVLSAPASTGSAQQGAPGHLHQEPFTGTSTPRTSSNQAKGARTAVSTGSNGGKGAAATTVSPHGSAQTTLPSRGLPSTTFPSQGATATTQPGSTTTQPGSTQVASGPTCPLGTNRSVGMAGTGDGDGYWVAASNGQVNAYGDAAEYPASSVPSAPIVSVSAVPKSSGYDLLAGDGTVVGVGAGTEGSASSVGPSCDAVTIDATPDGGGYWVGLSSGAVLTFGDAGFYGSAAGATGGVAIVGMAPTPDGKGYWMVDADGAVFPFGDAASHGALSTHLDAPIVGFTPTADGNGYWLVGADGGIFAFGDAGFYGSPAPSSSPVVAVNADPGGSGYWILEADGQVVPYGSAKSYPPA